MKVSVNKARVHVTTRNRQEGSVLRGTVKAIGLGHESGVELKSDEPPALIAAILRNAENRSFTIKINRAKNRNMSQEIPHYTPVRSFRNPLALLIRYQFGLRHFKSS